MAASSSTKAFLNWMYSTSFEDIPPDVRQKAVLALYDGIGCSLACSLLPVAHRMVDFVKVVGGPPDCSMIGFPLRTSVLNAALVNGALGHGDEVDAFEGELPHMGGHVMAAPLAAALTAGQLAEASGREVVRGAVLGYELQKRVFRVAAQAQGYPPKFGRIDTGNAMGAVAAAGIALGLPPDRMEVALSLGANQVCGITASSRETQHMFNSFQHGASAKNGVAAALMAKVGYDAPRDIFDGRQGFFHSRLGVEKPGPEFLSGLGQEYVIRWMLFKPSDVNGGSQAPRETLVALMSENGLTPDDIAEIQVEVNPWSFGLMTTVPGRTYGRDALALAAVYGGVGFREAHQESCYGTPQVLSMRERIKIQARQDWPGEEHRFHAVVTVTRKDGKKLRKESPDLIYRRMTEKDLDTKFSHLVGLRAGEAKAKELARVLKRLDTVSNVADVMVQLELPEASIDQV